MSICKHIACRDCLESYLIIEITESRTDIGMYLIQNFFFLVNFNIFIYFSACPQCSDPMHPSDIQILLKNSPEVFNKYEDFMVRRVLLGDPDSRWCPAPDCR